MEDYSIKQSEVVASCGFQCQRPVRTDTSHPILAHGFPQPTLNCLMMFARAMAALWSSSCPSKTVDWRSHPRPYAKLSIISCYA